MALPIRHTDFLWELDARVSASAFHAPRLSIVIPAYNEAARIVATLDEVLAYLATVSYSTEIVVVDDGSTDGTAEIVAETFPRVRVIRYAENRGKGFAVRTGMLAARGDVRLLYDADGSTPIREVEKVWPRIDGGADVVIGSRKLPESAIERLQPVYRQQMGQFYNRVLRALRLTDFPDTQCGFKAFTRTASASVFPKQRFHGFSFDAEVLYWARREGYRIEDVPVRWFDSPDSRVRPFRHSAGMLKDLLVLRLRTLGDLLRRCPPTPNASR